MAYVYYVDYIGDKYDTDQPWAVDRPGGMSYHRTKEAAKAEAKRRAKQNNGELVIENKTGGVVEDYDYRNQNSGSGSGGLGDLFGI